MTEGHNKTETAPADTLYRGKVNPEVAKNFRWSNGLVGQKKKDRKEWYWHYSQR